MQGSDTHLVTYNPSPFEPDFVSERADDASDDFYPTDADEALSDFFDDDPDFRQESIEFADFTLNFDKLKFLTIFGKVDQVDV